ncbi:MAG: BlaI/MecI/CopY family transcriptional regulator [Candidatus Zixiibacteriota bacterium]|nr:MAG: BlaI/MecI/CopY family transcriptional regulator [candidate division Zixibacteria bacterium]
MDEKGDISILFRPENKGLEKFMGKLESELMQIIWASGPMTVKRALYHINKEHKYAYTTVMTVMNNLVRKSILTREKKGHSFVYSPAMDERQFLKTATRKVLASLMEDYSSITVNIFHKVRKSPKKER